jgi:hypothetical protein
MEHDHMIGAFATNGANHPLDIGSLPGRARCRQEFANGHVSLVFSEVFAKDRIAVAQEVARELGKGKCLAQSLSGPICGRVGGHIEARCDARTRQVSTPLEFGASANAAKTSSRTPASPCCELERDVQRTRSHPGPQQLLPRSPLPSAGYVYWDRRSPPSRFGLVLPRPYPRQR